MSLLIFLPILVIILIDQLIKYAAVLYLKPVGSISFINGILDFVYVENKGAAFGILKDQRWFFIIVSSIFLIAFLFFILYKKVNSKLFSLATVFLVGGGISNMIDRIFLGYVIDYIQLSFFRPVCNFADYCIVIGAIFLSIYLLKLK